MSVWKDLVGDLWLRGCEGNIYSTRLPRHTWEYNIKKFSKKDEGTFGLALCGLGQGYFEVSCEDSSKLKDSVEGGDFDVCLSVHRSIRLEKKTNQMLLNALLQL